jgi:hypothetical protein
MTPSERACRDLLEAARRLLDETRGAAAGELAVLVTPDGLVVVTAKPPPVGRRPPLQCDILGALPPDPVSTRRLATLAGQRCNSYFRESLAVLVDNGLVRRTRNSYSRP